MLISIIEFIGRFHPVLVHLPIGVLIVALLLQSLFFINKYNISGQVLKIVWLLGALCAVISCITGYLLFISGEYDENISGIHLWMGIGVAVVSVVICSRIYINKYDNILKILSMLLLLLIIGTGHFGGSLTHGEDYLTSALNNETPEEIAVIKPLPDAQQAYIYADVVEPLLKAKCYSCHGAKKKKGELRMDNVEYLLKGGEDGKIVLPGNADSSEMIKRLLLPISHKKHMPPKQKSQFTTDQVELLHWWVATGASFDKKINELAQPEKIKPILAALQNGAEKDVIIPEIPVEPANEKNIEALREKGISVLPVAANSNYLMANFVNAPDIKNDELKLLLTLKKQLIWLKMNYANIDDSALDVIRECDKLQILQLSHTNITDKGLAALGNLKNLQSLNVTGTKITSTGLLQLKSLSQLKQVYLYKTAIDRTEWPQIKSAFPNTYLDSGGYTVPTLDSDTTIIKPK